MPRSAATTSRSPRRSTIPVVVQDHPASSGVPMSARVPGRRWPTRRRRAGDRQARGGAVAAEGPAGCASSPRRRRSLGGLGGGMLLEELAAGADGTMTGFGFPEVLVAIVRRWFAGDRTGRPPIFDRYATLIRFENQPLAQPRRSASSCTQRRGAIAHPTVRAPGGAARPGHGRVARLAVPTARTRGCPCCAGRAPRRAPARPRRG